METGGGVPQKRLVKMKKRCSSKRPTPRWMMIMLKMVESSCNIQNQTSMNFVFFKILLKVQLISISELSPKFSRKFAELQEILIR